MIERFTELLADPSAEGQRALLDAVSDLFLHEAAPSSVATDHFSHIAQSTLARMTDPDRGAYATRVAAEARLPQSVAVRLASDPRVAVAGPILKHSPVLTDNDLAATAAIQSPEGLIAMAERTSLSEAMTTILIERGNDAALHALRRNTGARYSRDGEAELKRRTAGQPAVPTGPASASIPASAKKSESPPVQIGQGVTTPYAGRQVRQKPQQRHGIGDLIADVRAGKRSVDEAITLFASKDQAYDLARLLGAIAAIPDTQALKCLLDPDTKPIGEICHTAGVSTEGFKAVLNVRAARLGFPPQRTERDLEAYELPDS